MATRIFPRQALSRAEDRSLVDARDGRAAGSRHLWPPILAAFSERLPFRAVQSILVLQLAGDILRDGRSGEVLGLDQLRSAIERLTGALSPDAMAAQLFGLFVGLSYLMPLAGGWLGDRLGSRRLPLLLGGALTASGYALASTRAGVLLGLLMVVLGAGAIRGNVAVQVADLHAPNDPRRGDSFQIYYLMLCLGGFVGPLAAGALVTAHGWSAATAACCAASLVGLAVYARAPAPAPDVVSTRAVLEDAGDAQGVLGLVVLWPLLVLYWMAQTQVWNVYNLWVRDHVDLEVAGRVLPIAWLQAFDSLCFVMLAPVAMALWRRRASAGRTPDAFIRMGWGCIVFAIALAWLAVVPLLTAEGRVAPILPIAFHLLANAGAVCVVPVATELFASAVAPGRRGRAVGTYTLAIFVAALASGRLAALYGTWSATAFWLLHAGLVGASRRVRAQRTAATGPLATAFRLRRRRTRLTAPNPDRRCRLSCSHFAPPARGW